jgi:hypothetical protein
VLAALGFCAAPAGLPIAAINPATRTAGTAILIKPRPSFIPLPPMPQCVVELGVSRPNEPLSIPLNQRATVDHHPHWSPLPNARRTTRRRTEWALHVRHATSGAADRWVSSSAITLGVPAVSTRPGVNSTVGTAYRLSDNERGRSEREPRLPPGAEATTSFQMNPVLNVLA